MERELDMYFSEFLRHKRKQMGVTQEELANRVHVSKSSVAKWESGRGIPDRTNMRELSSVLGISIDTMNRICEGCEKDLTDEMIVSEMISVLEAHGYIVTRR